MIWHTNVTIGDLHYLRSKFAVAQGFDSIYLSSFNRATEVFFHNKQFRVNGDYFLTWALLTPEWEANYMLGRMDWIEHATIGEPWIVEAYMPSKSLSAFKQLREIIPGKVLRFSLADGVARRINLPDLTE